MERFFFGGLWVSQMSEVSGMDVFGWCWHRRFVILACSVVGSIVGWVTGFFLFPTLNIVSIPLRIGPDVRLYDADLVREFGNDWSSIESVRRLIATNRGKWSGVFAAMGTTESGFIEQLVGPGMKRDRPVELVLSPREWGVSLRVKSLKEVSDITAKDFALLVARSWMEFKGGAPGGDADAKPVAVGDIRERPFLILTEMQRAVVAREVLLLRELGMTLESDSSVCRDVPARETVEERALECLIALGEGYRSKADRDARGKLESGLANLRSLRALGEAGLTGLQAGLAPVARAILRDPEVVAEKGLLWSVNESRALGRSTDGVGGSLAILGIWFGCATGIGICAVQSLNATRRGKPGRVDASKSGDSSG